MKRALSLLSFFSLSVLARAQGVDSARVAFCKERASADFAQKMLSLVIREEVTYADPEVDEYGGVGYEPWTYVREHSPHHLAFGNQPGDLKTGLCWWHSRFTRNATYLALYRPDLPKPDAVAAKKIIARIRDGKRVVEVPGYANLMQFSADWEDAIVKRLSDWEKLESFLAAGWIKGLKGRSSVSAKELSTAMDALYKKVSAREIVFQMLQMPGLAAHAWLVVGMVETPAGYDLTVVDSNTARIFATARPEKWSYRRGMTDFEYHNGANFVPYDFFADENVRLKKAVRQHCASK
jgi:hypothetical protein